MLDIALKYYELGFSIIPLKPKSKVPAVKSWERFKTTRATPEEIKQWWTKRPDCNIAIITGEISKITVVDVDTDDYEKIKKLKLPNTPIVKTSRGYHYYFSYKEIKNIKGYKGYVDLKNNAGYVVAPPSIHESGHEYRWVTDFPELIDDFEELPTETFDDVTSSPKAPFQDITKGVETGNRNNSAASYIGAIVKDMPPEKYTYVWPAVRDWNTKNTPPLAQNELLSVFNSITGKEYQRVTKGADNGNIVEKKPLRITLSQDWIDMELPEFAYTIDKIVPSKAITSMTADSGKGKSIVAVLMAKAVATGQALFGVFKTKKSKVLIVDQEMDIDLIAERYKAMFDEVCDVDIMAQQFWSINEQDDYDWLVDQIKEKKYGFIILDTLTTIHTKEENSATEMREINTLLLKLIADTGVTIMYLHHHRKSFQGEKSSQQSSRGSTEIIAKVASHLIVESTKVFEDDKSILDVKISQGKARRPEGINTIGVKVIYDEASNKTSWEYVGEVDSESKAVDKAIDFIRMEMEGNDYVTFAHLETKAETLEDKIGRDSLRQAISYMKKNTEIDSMTKRVLIEGGFATSDAVENIGNRVHFYVKRDNKLDY